MPTPIHSVAGMPLSIEARRPRTTPKPNQTFHEVLRTGARLLLAGASAASGLVGGPLLSSAVEAARSELDRGGGAASGPLAGQRSPTSGSSTGASGGTSEVEAMRQLQKEGQKQSLEYLALQQEVQAANRRFTVASNLLKARHDTARSAINNLRT